MKNLETLKFERLVKINLSTGMTSENAEECAKNQIERENLSFSQKFQTNENHKQKYDGVYEK